jgi:hypothetical protein
MFFNSQPSLSPKLVILLKSLIGRFLFRTLWLFSLAWLQVHFPQDLAAGPLMQLRDIACILHLWSGLAEIESFFEFLLQVVLSSHAIDRQLVVAWRSVQYGL